MNIQDIKSKIYKGEDGYNRYTDVSVEEMDYVVAQAERVGMLEIALEETLNDIQKIRDNSNKTQSSIESSVRNYFERIKKTNSIYYK